ncbi:Ion channel [Gracilaria domingensis]|nr:Ion channel [Gracilaria domingensis]
MDEAEPKSDLLWGFIARSVYLGLIAYVVTAVVAFWFDYCRRYLINYGPRNLNRSLRRLPKLQRFLIKYRGGSSHFFFYALELFRFVLNLLVCIVYVHGTYLQNVAVYMEVIYGISSRLFLVDVVLRLVSTESAFSSVFSLQMLVDSFSYPSIWIAKGPNGYLNLAFLRAVALYRSYLVLERLLFIQVMSSRRLLFKLLVQNLVLFYTLAGAIQLLEIPGDLLPTDFRNKWFNFGEWTFLNSCYFIIVTLSTVGYGDFSPATVQGRIFTLFIIIIGIVIFASIVSELVEHARRGRGAGWFVKNRNTRHVIVTGSPSRTDLIHFITEFFADPRGSNKNARIVVLVDEVTWSDAEWYQYIAKNYFLQIRVQYLSGSVGNSLDLRRAGIETADAVFVLSSFTNGQDPSVQDTKTIMSALAIRNTRTDIPIYAQTLLENSNLQTYTALTTPSTFSKEDTYFRGKEMSRSAGYAGLYFKVLELEYETIPELQRKANVLRRFEEHIHSYLDTQEGTDRHHPLALGKDDLARSQLVCLQEIQMALMSGNIKANGTGTLLSNMYLDVQSPKFAEDEPPWLSEYHLGASCELAYAIVPKELDGVTVQDIAIDLCHLGLLIVALSDAKDPVPRPILKTDTVLCRGDLAMILTYHELGAVAAGLHLVGLRHARKTLEKRPPSLESGGNFEVHHPAAGMRNLSAPDARRGHDHHHELDGISPSYGSLLHSRRRRSGDDLDALIDDDDMSMDNKLPPNSLLDEAKSDQVPEELKGHVIIAPDGEAGLDNLTLLLANLWRKDERKSVLEIGFLASQEDICFMSKVRLHRGQRGERRGWAMRKR